MPPEFALIAIGLTLVLIHLIGIPVTNISATPPRNTGIAIWVDKELFTRVWLFWFASIVGAVSTGFTYHTLFTQDVIEQDWLEAMTDDKLDCSHQNINEEQKSIWLHFFCLKAEYATNRTRHRQDNNN